MRRIWLAGTAVPIAALAVASFMHLPAKLIYNGSASAPAGFYWLDSRPIERGEYVLSRVPERVRGLVSELALLPPGVPLIKRVAGLEGDKICRRDREILINGATVAVALRRDDLVRPLPDWQGCHMLEARSVFLLQGHPRSFDGRYFGPVDQSLILGRATRLGLP